LEYWKPFPHISSSILRYVLYKFTFYLLFYLLTNKQKQKQNIIKAVKQENIQKLNTNLLNSENVLSHTKYEQEPSSR